VMIWTREKNGWLWNTKSIIGNEDEWKKTKGQIMHMMNRPT
jgi:hypothetical protein